MLSTAINGKVFVYDSLYDFADVGLKRQLCQIYKYFVEDGHLDVSYPKLLKQKGSNDCGLFCLAYAIDIASGVMPDNECYLQEKFRNHFQSCLDLNYFERFPRDNIENEKMIFKAESHVRIPVFCDCMLPATPEMIKCYYCSELYHIECLEKFDDININEEFFECHNCKRMCVQSIHNGKNILK